MYIQVQVLMNALACTRGQVHNVTLLPGYIKATQFEEVCLRNQPTLRFIPSRSRPAFARALSSALRCVIQENSEEAWLKLFMLPKCVLPSFRRQGRHDKPLPVDVLCNMWTDNDLGPLWNLAKGRAISHTLQSTSSIHQTVTI